MVESLVVIGGVLVFAAMAVGLALMLKNSQDDPDRTSNGEPMTPPSYHGPS